jgi:hypothetical protein
MPAFLLSRRLFITTSISGRRLGARLSPKPEAILLFTEVPQRAKNRMMRAGSAILD